MSSFDPARRGIRLAPTPPTISDEPARLRRTIVVHDVQFPNGDRGSILVQLWDDASLSAATRGPGQHTWGPPTHQEPS